MTNLRDGGVALARAAVGAICFGHGARKLFGWYGGDGLNAAAASFERMGFRPPLLHAVAAGSIEAGGGLMLAAGLATPTAGLSLGGAMAVAASTNVDKGFFAQGGYELPAALGAVSVGLGLAGPGSWSLDRLFRYRLDRNWIMITSAVLVTAVATGIIRRRTTARSARSRPRL